jgi:hypothetical protein
MSWTEIEKQLREIPAEEILDLMKGLHDISPQNRAWLKGKLLPISQDTKYLEDCRRKVAKHYRTVRVREVRSSNLGIPTERTNILMDDSFCHP